MGGGPPHGAGRERREGWGNEFPLPPFFFLRVFRGGQLRGRQSSGPGLVAPEVSATQWHSVRGSGWCGTLRIGGCGCRGETSDAAGLGNALIASQAEYRTGHGPQRPTPQPTLPIGSCKAPPPGAALCPEAHSPNWQKEDGGLGEFLPPAFPRLPSAFGVGLRQVYPAHCPGHGGGAGLGGQHDLAGAAGLAGHEDAFLQPDLGAAGAQLPAGAAGQA